jgi:hypothetical protein
MPGCNKHLEDSRQQLTGQGCEKLIPQLSEANKNEHVMIGPLTIKA